MYALRFVKGFLRAPGQVGAIAPSGRELSDAVAEAAGVPQASVIVEFGPGTGSITRSIVEKSRPDATFFALEIDPDFVEALRRRFPDVRVFQDSAANAGLYLEQLGADGCDCIVSGLPWAAFPEDLQDELLGSMLDVLKPGGKFATYMYLSSMCFPAAGRFRRKLAAAFPNSGMTTTVWWNLPPAAVFQARR